MVKKLAPTQAPIPALMAGFAAHNRRALARLITYLDDGSEVARILKETASNAGHALKVGLTGSTGAGKSTLIAALIRHLRQQGQSVAVLACDPASPITGGALLGDRIRMDVAPEDAGVFIRSISTRGAAGGLSQSTGPIVRLLDRFGFDVILIETVGAGQDQTAVRDLVDVLMLVVTPAGGDDIQWQKAGLAELADIIALNKADFPGAEVAAAQIHSGLDVSRRDGANVPLIKVIATTAQGVPELWLAIKQNQAATGILSRTSERRARNDSRASESKSPAPGGFLPDPDPLDHLPGIFSPWEEISQEMPKLLVAGQLRRRVEQMPILNAEALADEAACRRAMVMLSFMGHGYVWGEQKPVDRIPAPLAIPWHAVAQRLGRLPVLSYASYALDNWRRMDPHGPIALGNIVLLQNFLGGVDEEWFVLVHVQIEAEAAPAIAALKPAQVAVAQDRPAELTGHLTTVAAALERMHHTLEHMPELCDPYIYFNRVRPYIHGWREHPALPNGIAYEGVTEYAGRPQQFRGETGAQSAIIPALDAALGIGHAQGPLAAHLAEMQEYMPPEQREFIAQLKRGQSIRDYAIRHRADSPKLIEAYDACIEHIAAFRRLHLHYADRYIHSQSQRSADNPADVGTGGTPFMPYLHKHWTETKAHHL